MVEIPDVVWLMDHWIQSEADTCHHVVNTGMHGIMEAHRDPEFKDILNTAALLAPDGILVVQIARLRGFPLQKKKTGPELMWEFSKTAGERGYKYFILGDTEDTLRLLAAKLGQEFPGLVIAGVHSPPFRPLTPEEDDTVVRTINQSGAGCSLGRLGDAKTGAVDLRASGPAQGSGGGRSWGFLQVLERYRETGPVLGAQLGLRVVVAVLQGTA